MVEGRREGGRLGVDVKKSINNDSRGLTSCERAESVLLHATRTDCNVTVAAKDKPCIQ